MPTTTSLARPVTVTVASVVTDASDGVSIVMCGGVVSNVIWTVAVLATPAELVATAVRTLSPSTNGTGIENRPELYTAGIPLMASVAPGSLMVPFTVTGVRFVTLRFVGLVMVSCGAGA